MRLPPGHFFGDHVRRGSAGALVAVETNYPAGLVTTRHTHERSCFCVVIGGGFAERYGRAERRCTSGTVIFRPAGEDHANDFALGAHCLNLELSEAWMERLAEYAPTARTSLDLTGTAVSEPARRLWREFQIADDLTPIALEGLAIETLAGLSRLLREPAAGPPAWLARVRERLHATPSPPTLADLAADAEVHPVHLARSFRRHYRVTIGAYVRRLRVDAACRLLDTTTLPLAQIALQVGFSDQSHFANAFRRAVGCTPSAYRRR